MKSLYAALLLILCALISSCGPKKGYAPRTIKGMTISYYTESSNEPCDRKVVGKTIVYHYNEDGTYVSKIDGQHYLDGSYSYGRRGPNIASMTFTYPTTESDPDSLSSPDEATSSQFSYMEEMVFKTPTFGTWRTIYTHCQNYLTSEYGTFEILEAP